MKRGLSTDQLVMLILTCTFFLFLLYYLGKHFFGG
jgi:hypothetical protein